MSSTHILTKLQMLEAKVVNVEKILKFILVSTASAVWSGRAGILVDQIQNKGKELEHTKDEEAKRKLAWEIEMIGKQVESMQERSTITANTADAMLFDLMVENKFLKKVKQDGANENSNTKPPA